MPSPARPGGKDALSLSHSFEQFPLHPALLVGLEQCKFTAPTALQAHTIPIVFDGRDLIAQAKPGSGQTLAFGLPMLSLLDPEHQPQAVVLVPNRDRCMRVWDVLSAIGADTGLKIVALHAGLGLTQQEQMLRRGADIVVGTPGRVKDLLGPRRLDLSKVRILILDGADIMVDEGLRREVETLVERMPAREQTAVFATHMPEGLAALAKRYLKDPVLVRLTGAAKAARPAESVLETEAASGNHYFLRVDEQDQFDALIALMKAETPKRALVFTRARQELKRLAQQIERDTTLRTGCVTRDMSTNARSSMLGRFRSGDHRVLVVGDADTGGLAVDELTHVFYLGLPGREMEHDDVLADGHAEVKTTYLVTPEAEDTFRVLRERVAFRELEGPGQRVATAAVADAGARKPRTELEGPAPARRGSHGPEREPRRRNRLGPSRAPAHGHEPGALLAAAPEERPSTGPLAPLPRMRTSWQTFKVALEPGRRPSRDTVHSWLAQETGVPRSSLRSIVVGADFATVEVEGREVEKFQLGLQDRLISS